MQYSFATAISTVLFASTIVSGAVIPRQSDSTITVQFKTGDGDSSVQQSFTAGQLVTTAAQGVPITPAVNGQIVSEGAKCQFFSDAKGTKKVGGVLSSDDTAPVQFTSASTGGTDSVSSDAVQLGSAFCASAAAFDAGIAKLGGSGSKNSGSKTSGSSDIFAVLIQIDGLSEQATQGEIPADGKPHKLAAPLIGSDATSASVVHTHKAVNCQAADAQGKPLGGTFAVRRDADFGVPAGVTVDTVTCTQL